MGSAAARAAAALRRVGALLRPASSAIRSARPPLRPVRSLYPPRAATSPSGRAVVVIVRVMVVRSATPLPCPARSLLHPGSRLLHPATSLPRPASPLPRPRRLLRPVTSATGLAPTGEKSDMAKICERLDSMGSDIKELTIRNAKHDEALEKIAVKQCEEPKRDWGSFKIRGRPLNVPGFVSLAWRFLDMFK